MERDSVEDVGRRQQDEVAPSSRLTLRALANEPGLGLTVVHPGDLGRAIHRAHTIEIANPAQWLEPESVVLTTGLRFAGMPEGDGDQAALVDNLADVETSALLFGVGVHFRAVPTGIVIAARRRDLSLLSVSPETPFYKIEDFVNRSTLAAGSQRMARALRLHQDLLGALSAPEPIATLIGRLAGLCRGCAVLYDVSGEPVASAGGGPVRLIWNEIAAAPPVSLAFSVGRWRIASRPLKFSDSSLYLAIASRDSYLIADVGKDILSTAEQVLAAAHGMRAVSRNKERDEARRLMSSLCSGLPDSRVRQTSERLRVFGFRPGMPVRFLAASPAKRPGSAPKTRTSGALIERARTDRIGMVLADADAGDDGEPSLTALVSVGVRTDAWLQLLSRTHVAGVSAVFTDLAAVPLASSEALTAYWVVMRQNQRGGHSRILRLDEMDLATWLVAGRGHHEVKMRVDRHLANLREHAGLVDTLVMYLACNQDVSATAMRLFVHPNTVRYRLSRAENLLGEDLRDTPSIVNLYLALQETVHALILDA